MPVAYIIHPSIEADGNHTLIKFRAGSVSSCSVLDCVQLSIDFEVRTLNANKRKSILSSVNKIRYTYMMICTEELFYFLLNKQIIFYYFYVYSMCLPQSLIIMVNVFFSVCFFRSLQQLLDYEEEDIEDTFLLNFAVIFFTFIN